jgi:glycogen(starch) synthase
MKITLISNFDLTQLGGVQVAVCNLAEQLTRLDHSVLVLANSCGVDRGPPVDLLGNTFERHNLSAPSTWPFGRTPPAMCWPGRAMSGPAVFTQFVTFLKRLRDFQPDIVNLHYLGEARAFCLAATQLCGLPFVISLHGEDVEAHARRSTVGRWLSSRCLMAADRVLSNSHHLQQRAQDICPAIRGKCAVVANGVDIDDFRKATPYRHRRPYVLSVGRLVHKKGFDVLLRAFAEAHNEWPGVDLVIAGDGPERAALSSLIGDLDLGDSVLLFGPAGRSVIPSLLAGSTMLVLPSRREPFGIVLLEAMAAKKAIVASSTGGIPEIVTHMRTGILVQPESHKPLAEAIRLLLANEPLRLALAEGGFREVRHRFVWPRIVRGYLDALSPLVHRA